MTDTGKTTLQPSHGAGEASGPVGLPCRGCLPDCKNRAICQGKPWRTLGDAQNPTPKTTGDHA